MRFVEWAGMRWEWEPGEDDSMLGSKQNESTSSLWDPVVGGLQDSSPDLVSGNRDKGPSAKDRETKTHPMATKHR